MKQSASIVIYCPQPAEVRAYLDAFRQHAPDFRFHAHDEASLAEPVQKIICWGPPPGFFTRYPQLDSVFALGAGVDKLVQRPDLKADVAIYRLLDAGMAEQMLEYVLHGVLSYQRDFDRYRQQQAHQQWRPFVYRTAAELRVTILGAGEMGGHVARGLQARGYAVSVWSRQPKTLAGIASVAGSENLAALLRQTDVLVNVLPSTAATRGLLDATRLQQLARGAMLINAGRGDVLEETALLQALDSGQLRAAQLDVFSHEPLAATHPFWRHPAIVLTPHVAAQTQPLEAVHQIAANLQRLQRGEAGTGRVDRQRAY